jgi:hypothetical protein
MILSRFNALSKTQKSIVLAFVFGIILVVLVAILYPIVQRDTESNTSDTPTQSQQISENTTFKESRIDALLAGESDVETIVSQFLQSVQFSLNQNEPIAYSPEDWSMLMMLTRSTLENNAFEDSKGLRALYDSISIPTDLLDLNGVEYEGLEVSSRKPHTSLFGPITARAQEDCSEDYTNLATCFDSSRYTQFDQQHRLHVHANIPNPERFRELIPQSYNDSFDIFSSLGHEAMPMFYIVRDIPSDGGSGIYADAEYQRIDGVMTCRINIWSPLIDQSEENINKFLFIMAHEYYHCIQYRDFGAKIQPVSEQKFWWVEGTAEAMADQVYPDFNIEHERNNVFDIRSNTFPLTRITYPNYLMFQYLINTNGYPWLRQFLQDLPSSEVGETQYQQHLITYKDFYDQYHTFSTLFVSQELIDTSGEPNPARVEGFLEEFILDETPVVFKGAPFVINRYRVQINPIEGVLRLDVHEEELPQSNYKTRNADGGTSWVETFPAEVGYQSCNDDPWQERLLVMSYFDTDASATYDVTATPTQLEGFGDSIDLESLTEDTNLYGNWVIDIESQEESKQEVFSGLEDAFSALSGGAIVASNTYNYYETELCFYPRNLVLAQTKYQIEQKYQTDFGDITVLTTQLERFVSRYDIQEDRIVFINPELAIEGGTTTTTPFGTETVPATNEPIEDQIFSFYRVEGDELVMQLPVEPFSEVRAKRVQ